jgi:3-phenylpropionate/trans-cinnamate dioxygenase ferredoxin reductase subunit
MSDGLVSVVIIGGGQAGSEAATQLRQAGFAGAITILGDEPHLPYSRPPLSKAYLAGEIATDALLVRNAKAYETAKIDVRLGATADKIDRVARQVVISGGERVAYDRLILATGGRPRRMNVTGGDLKNIFYLRSIADVDLLRAALQPGRRLVIVGGGYIGLEVAAVAVKSGLAVTVLEGAARVLARVTSPEMSAFYERFHQAKGVDIRTGIAVSGFTAADDGVSVGAVACGGDYIVPADLVIIGIGLVPNVELAQDAGLVVDNGILVDDMSRTSDVDIYAIGDCAAHRAHGFLKRQVRLESVPNVNEQARTVAAAICGKALPASAPPWFWSDQYDLKLQMVGLSEGYDELVVRGAPESNSFITFYLKDGHVIAADAVSRLGEFMVAKKLVAGRRKLEAAQLADEAISLKSLVDLAPA